MIVLMEYNARRRYDDVTYARADSDEPFVLWTNCNNSFDVVAVCFLLNVREGNAPFLCPSCSSSVRIDSKYGVFGFHEAWCSGHSMSQFPKLLSYFSHPTVDVEHDAAYWDDLSFAIKTMHRDCVPLNYRSVEPPNFATQVVVDAKDTAPGVIANLPRCYKKKHVATAACAYIQDLATTIYQQTDSLSSAMKMTQSAIPSIAQCAIKAEVKCGKIRPLVHEGVVVGHEYVVAPGERMFFVVHIILSTILRMIFGIFAACCGLGHKGRNMPIAIGMSFFGHSAQQLAGEMFKCDWDSLTLRLPRDSTADDIIAGKDRLEKTLLDQWIVLEWDVQKWDIHMLASLLANVARSFGAFYEIYDDALSRTFMAFFLRAVECHKFKVFNCPTGGGWFGIAAAMMSGSWDTSYMNSACNYVAQIVVLKRINPSFFELPNWRDFIAIKVFGDDALATFSRQHWNEDQLKKIPDLMKSMFRFNIPPEDFKIHSKILEHAHVRGYSFDKSHVCTRHENFYRNCQDCEGWFSGGDYPTFLKFRWILVECPRCSGDQLVYHWSFAREGYKVLPKLFVDSTKPLTLINLRAKLIGYLYTVGITPSIYSVIRELMEIVANYGNIPITANDLSEDLDHRFGIKRSWWHDINLTTIPPYKQLIDRMVCPYETSAPLYGTNTRKVAMPCVLARMQYKNWQEYSFSLAKCEQ
jgi:hypothetical protein